MSAIRIELELKDGSFVSGMLRAGQSIDGFKRELARLDPHFRGMIQNNNNAIRSFQRIDNQGRTFLGTMRDVSVVAGAVGLAFSALTGGSGGLIGSIIQTNAEMEKLRFQMEGMSSAADPVADAAAQVDYLREMATRAPFSIKELTSTFVKLKSSGIDEVDRSMQALVDGIAAFGGSDEQLHRVTLGITQMAGKGVIQMEEMRQQLGESMPSAMRIMARSMGISVAELIDAISTGKLEAKSSLQAFTEELERSFGGSAARMMQTFSGQVTLLSANFQKLVTSGGPKTFFDELKGYLQEFNDFLASGTARSAADMLGNALSSVASAFVTGAKLAYQFADALKAIAITVGGLMVLNRLRALVGGLGQQYALLRGQLGLTWATFRQGTAAMTSAAAANAAAGASAHVLAFGMHGARLAAVGLFGTIATLAPYLVVIGTGAYFLAEQFGLLGNKTDEAYESLRKYGAESRKQAMETLDAKEAELLAKLEDARSDYYWDFNDEESESKRKKMARIKQAEEDLARMRETRQYYLDDAMQTEIENEQRILDRKLEMSYANANKRYQDKQTALDNEYQAAVDAAAKEGRSTSEIDRKYGQDSLENRRELARGKLAEQDRELAALEAKQKEASAKGDKIEEQRMTALIGFVRGKRTAIIQELSAIPSEIEGPNLVETPEDDTAKRERGTKLLETMREQIAGLAADIAGASSEEAKLMAQIERGDFGTVEDGGDAYKKLVNDLINASREVEHLKKVADGVKLRDELQRNVKNLTLQLEGADTELAKINAKIAAGDFGNIEKGGQQVAKLHKDLRESAAKIDLLNARIAGAKALQDLRNDIDLTARGLSGATSEMARLEQQIARGDFGTIREGGADVAKLHAELRTAADRLDTLNRMVAGANAFRSLRDEVDLTVRELGGASSEMAKLEQQIVAGDFGTIEEGGDAVRALHDQLRRAVRAKEALDRVMKGRDEIAGDIEAMQKKVMEDRIALEARQKGIEMTDAEVALEKLKRGYYAGLGPIDNIRKAVQDLSSVTIMQGTVAEEAGRVMSEITFGDNMLNQVNTLGQAIANVTAQLSGMGAAAGSIRLPSVGPMQPGSAAGGFDFNAFTFGTPVGTPTPNVNPTGFVPVAPATRTPVRGMDTTLAAKIEADGIRMTQAYTAALEELAVEQQAIADSNAALDFADDVKDMSTELKVAQDVAAGMGSRVAQLRADIAAGKYGTITDADNARYAEALRIAGELDQLDATDNGGGGGKEYTDEDRAKLREQMQDEINTARDSLMSQAELRRVQFDRRLTEIDKLAAEMRAAGMEEVEITRMTEEAKAAIREEYSSKINPVAAQMTEWGKLQDNLQQGAARWMDSAASGIAGLITGTGDLKSAVNGMISDIANMGVRYMFSQIMPATGKGSSMKAVGQAAGKAATGGKMPVGIKHTGGIVGQRGGMVRLASAAMFQGADRFHTGGVVGGMKLKAGEVPIIAKKGEGVFTPEQMRAMGGAGGNAMAMTINAPVSVNGSGGSYEQNNDLAKQIGREMEATMRMVVVDEMRKQIRPGNMMNTRSR